MLKIETASYGRLDVVVNSLSLFRCVSLALL
jgi:hypothetical protein